MHPSEAEETPVTDLLRAWRGGKNEAREELFQRVYLELKRLAGAQVRMRSATMAPTELVHETYLKLLGAEKITAKDREHFYSLAARAMRQILVDTNRRRVAAKRGGSATPDTLDANLVGSAADPRAELLALDVALNKLEELDPKLVRTVELRHFGGLTVEQTAAEMKLSERSVKRHWRSARAFLFDQLSSTEDGRKDAKTLKGS